MRRNGSPADPRLGIAVAWMNPSPCATADPKRPAESRIVDGYGTVQKVDFLRTEGSCRLFRVEHSYGVVDWFVADDGKQIRALTWRKVRNLPRQGG